MNAGRTALGTAYVQFAGGEVDIVPPERHKLAGAQAMPVGDQHGRRVPVALAVFLATSISFSISRSVRYSRGRDDRTVTFTRAGALVSSTVFPMVFPIAACQLLQF